MQKNTVEAGGSAEESAEGLRSIAVIFPMMTFLMLTILMVQLQSFQKMLLEISVAPIDKGGRLAWSELPRDPNRQFFTVINVWLMSFSQPSLHASMGPETRVVSASASGCITGLHHALMELMAGALIEGPTPTPSRRPRLFLGNERRGDRGPGGKANRRSAARFRPRLPLNFAPAAITDSRLSIANGRHRC